MDNESGLVVSTYKAHIFKHRQVGAREEVKLKIFDLGGSPVDLGGGVGSKIFGGWSNEVQLSNGGQDVVVDMGSAEIELEQGNVLTDAPAGAYLVKLKATWEIGSALSLGAAQIVLIHIADDDSESVLGSLVMSPEDGVGDMDLSDVHFMGEKVDAGIAPTGGRLELRASQTTDQSFIGLITRVLVAKL